MRKDDGAPSPRRVDAAVPARASARCARVRAALLEAHPGDGTELETSIAVFAPAPAACRGARELVRTVLADIGSRRSTYAAELVASELAGNAVRHARSSFEVRLSLLEGAVRIAVTDETPVRAESWELPVAHDHGLGIVASLALGWGYEPLAGGKLVWADVPCAAEE